MGWFGDQDTKTSQEPKFWKNGKLGILIKFQKGDITVVSEHDLGTWCDDIHIHECIYETSLSHLNSSCFPCSLFCSDFGGGSPFTYWIREHTDDYIDAHYISFGVLM